MVKNVPLTVDLRQRTVGVVVAEMGFQRGAVAGQDGAAGVHEDAAAPPGPARRIGIGIPKRRIALRQTIFLAGEAAVQVNVLVPDLPERGGLIELEVIQVLPFRDGQEVDHLTLPDAGPLDVLFQIVSNGLSLRKICQIRRDHGRNPERVVRLPVAGRIHRVLVQLRRAGPLDAPGAIGPETDRIIRIVRIVDLLDQHARVEAHDAAGRKPAVLDVQDRERAVRTVADAHHRRAHQGMGIQVILARAVVPARHLHEVRRINRAHIPVQGVREHRTFVPPGGQVLHRRRPLTVVLSAVTVDTRIMRARYINAVMPRVVRILEYARFPVGNVLPQRQVGITDEIGGLGNGTATGNEGQAKG